ncbi:MAG: KEOPS complex subunit Pcc1 [Candidatus Bathyarchaeota archaeon]|nr:KEOPS complex subunit Pcc1 [Candidatus Bathyarchaeota archaeon]
MVAEATVRLSFTSEKLLQALIIALSPELINPTSRSKATISQEDLTCVLTVKAEDTVALRAALNAYLRWINSAISVLETLEK